MIRLRTAQVQRGLPCPDRLEVPRRRSRRKCVDGAQAEMSRHRDRLIATDRPRRSRIGRRGQLLRHVHRCWMDGAAVHRVRTMPRRCAEVLPPAVAQCRVPAPVVPTRRLSAKHLACAPGRATAGHPDAGNCARPGPAADSHGQLGCCCQGGQRGAGAVWGAALRSTAYPTVVERLGLSLWPASGGCQPMAPGDRSGSPQEGPQSIGPG